MERGRRQLASDVICRCNCRCYAVCERGERDGGKEKRRSVTVIGRDVIQMRGCVTAAGNLLLMDGWREATK